MVPFAFCFTALLISALLLALTISIVSPLHGIWPPAAQQIWQFVLVWALTLLVFLGIIVVGLLDWNSLAWPPVFRWTAGCALVVIGNALAWVGVAQLSVRATSGAENELVTDGLYRFTRNPQYCGDILILLGWFVVSASLWVLPLTVGGVLAFLLAPRAEEPWLEGVYGRAYQSYRD